MASDTAAEPPGGEPARCVVVCFTGPLAGLPQRLATLKRAGLPIEARRCKSLLDFARELRDGAARLAVIDCGPGNLRVEEAVSVYRRAAHGLPLALVGGESAALRGAVQDLADCQILEPDDLPGLAAQIRAACGLAPQDHRADDGSGVVTGEAPASLAGREALLEALRPALLADAAHAVLAIVHVDPEPAGAALGLAARIVAETFGTAASLAPLGGARFGMLLQIADTAAGVAPAHEARERLRATLQGDAAEPPAVALGLSPPRATDGDDPAAWLARAGQACDVALRTGHGYAVLSRTPVTTPTARDLPALLQEALVADRLQLQFQPIVSLRGDAREHYETLVRLPSPAAGELLPADFFGAAASSGLLGALDHWVIRHAIRRLAHERRTNRRIHLFIPLSGQGLADDRLLLAVCDHLRDAQASGDWLTFQIRPGDVRAHPGRTRRLVDGLRQVRCRLALDHYDGEPLAREVLAALPFEFAKLAPAVTRDLAGAPARLDWLRSTLTLLARRGVKSVATGIEDARSLAYLWAAGIDYAQGFFLHEPTEVIAYEEGG